jgi:putative hydrolase of the HAD superfamily
LIKAIVFDFDGLIIDTETAWYYAFKKTMEAYDCQLPLELFSQCVGTDDTVLHEFFRTELGERCNIEEIEAKAKDLHTIQMEKIEAREGVKDYLEEAKALGYQIGLASSSRKEWVTSYLKRLGLLHYFEVIVTGDMVEKVKPAPDLYVKAMERLHVQPSEALAFEDSLNGSKAALAAGLRCIIVPNPVTEFLAFEPHHIRLASMAEKSLREVVQLVEQRQ